MIRLATAIAAVPPAGAALLALAVCSPHAGAEPPFCADRPHLVATADLAQIAAKAAEREGAGGLRRLWGRENLSVLPKEPETSGPVLRVRYPRGSVNPGTAEAPRGGAGFELAWPPGEARCLSYRLRFPAGFAFVKGGKLPGLFGGDAPRGCGAAEFSKGFSARLMWRTDGAGELYLYAPDRTSRCGESIERGSWTFATGRWLTVSEEIVLNTPGRSDGVARIWIDGAKVVERTNLMLRDESGIKVDGLLFSTFFGGSDESWASPGDQYADFADFVLRE